MATKTEKTPGNATGLRVGAVILWLAGIALEIVALLALVGKIPTGSDTMRWVLGIGALVLDLICVVIGSQLWKKSNRIDPASEKNKVKFWLWNNMGVIASVLAFLPFIILLLTNKDADAKTKKIGSIVAVVALLIAGLASYDFDPVSQEMLDAANNVYGATAMYYTKSGKVCHPHQDCQYIKNSELVEGTAEEAIRAGYTRPCKTCMAKDVKAGVITQEQMDEMVQVFKLDEAAE